MAEKTLEQQLQSALEEAELTLEQLHLAHEELEMYFFKSQDLKAELNRVKIYTKSLQVAEAKSQEAAGRI